MSVKPLILIALSTIFVSTSAYAENEPLKSEQVDSQQADENAPVVKEDSKLEATGRRAGEIVTQPVRDVGLDKDEVPPLLQQARELPYTTKNLKSCVDYRNAILALNELLGPDFADGAENRENIAGKLAEAGGKTVINAFIPFRGLVREISGAAPAERRYAAALSAGIARRGFLRGIYLQRACKPAF